jgi:hypothetical protein
MANPGFALSDAPPAPAPATPTSPDAPPGGPASAPAPDPKISPPEHLGDVMTRGNEGEIKARIAADMAAILDQHGLSKKYCCLALMEPQDSISAFDLDRIYAALQKANAVKDRDVLLMLLSHGGAIEPAYQISKICKAFAKQKFVATVPRQAKSAATLIALGADEIHMSVLGQLGPIDPQLGGLPALGVAQALQRIAEMSQNFPGSADMFAKYLQQALTVEQIGYCERIAESAEQYAQRLLAGKPALKDTAAEIAKEMVHTYKDHGFVIDLVEARDHLGDGWIKDGTPEVAASEQIYEKFQQVSFLASFILKKRVLMLGQLGAPSDIFLWALR